MNNFWLMVADRFFLIFHTSFTLFNIFGWIFKKTRKAHLITMIATSFSWFFLGIWYGIGYCFCTHWHWLVRNRLGNPIRSHSYIHFLIREITGLDLNTQLVDWTVMALFVFTFIVTISINLHDYLKYRKK